MAAKFSHKLDTSTCFTRKLENEMTTPWTSEMNIPTTPIGSKLKI